MQMTIKELLSITALLLKYAESKGHTVVQFANQDSWYQKISYENRDFEGIPAYTIGDLDDALEYLGKVLKDKYCSFPYALEWLGAALTMFGVVVSRDTFVDDMIRPRGKLAEQLTTKQILRVTKVLLKYIYGEQYNSILVSFSPEDALYQRVRYQDHDFGGNPKITVGSANDDLVSLKELLDRKRLPCAYDLERLGTVFTVLGSVMTKTK
jgi:hypothetical protein